MTGSRREYLWRQRAKKRRRARRIILVSIFAVIFLSAVIISWAFERNGGEKETQAAPIEEMNAEGPEMAIEEPDAVIFQDQHSMDWDADESYLLAKIAMAEAEGEGIEGKAMVIMVVLNRVWADGFPGTIEDVIFEHSGDIYQFSPVAPGGRWWTTEPDEECWEALRLIMVEKWDESEGALYFEATYNGEDTWHSKNLEYIKTVENHNFYR